MPPISLMFKAVILGIKWGIIISIIELILIQLDTADSTKVYAGIGILIFLIIGKAIATTKD